jgi:hypothetical protein
MRRSESYCDRFPFYRGLDFPASSCAVLTLWKKKTYPIFRMLTTPWSRVLLEKLTVTQLVKKFPAFYGTRKFITVFTGPF